MKRKRPKLVQSIAGNSVRVLPGGLYVARNGQEISTVLGSCISICVYDRERGIGGMNHYMLPEASQNIHEMEPDTLNKYGCFAIPNLLSRVASGKEMTSGLEIKVFGGGQVLRITSDIGYENSEYALRYFEKNNIEVAVVDVGGVDGRSVRFNTKTGAVLVKRISGDSEEVTPP